MSITIKIDFECPRWVRRSFAVVAVPLIVLGASTVVRADVSVQNKFAAGDVVSSQLINDNFKVLEDAINDVGGRPQSFSVALTPLGDFANPQGDWVVSSARTGSASTGYTYVVNFKTGTFASPPNCTCSVVLSGGTGCSGDSICNISGTTNGSVSLLVTTISAAPQWYVGNCPTSLICNGSN